MSEEVNKISIIIGTYNRCESLKRTLDSIALNRVSESVDYEVIVVDNNSTDTTKDIVQNYMDSFGGRLRYVFEPNQGLNFARNKGIEEAKGGIIVYTDDDVIVGKDWIDQINEFFKKTDCVAVGGRVLPDYPDNTPWWVKQYKDILSGAILIHDYGNQTLLYDRSKMNQFVGANIAFKKSVFNECGGFNTNIGVGQKTMGAETEMFNRLSAMNKKIYYCGGIQVWHPVEPKRMTLIFIARWNVRLGRYFVLTESENEIKNLKKVGHVPIYLFRRMLANVIKICIGVFNKEQFLTAWVRFFRDFGMATQYRKVRQS